VPSADDRTVASEQENIQVAQLWQRNRAKLDTFSIKVQRYSQNQAQNCIFVPPYGGIRGNICVLIQKDFIAEFHRKNASFTRKTANLRF